MLPHKEEWRTFNVWNRRGAKIKKGAKATWFEGVAKFSREQVTFSSPWSDWTWYEDNHWDVEYELDPHGLNW